MKGNWVIFWRNLEYVCVGKGGLDDGGEVEISGGGDRMNISHSLAPLPVPREHPFLFFYSRSHSGVCMCVYLCVCVKAPKVVLCYDPAQVRFYYHPIILQPVNHLSWRYS